MKRRGTAGYRETTSSAYAPTARTRGRDGRLSRNHFVRVRTDGAHSRSGRQVIAKPLRPLARGRHRSTQDGLRGYRKRPLPLREVVTGRRKTACVGTESARSHCERSSPVDARRCLPLPARLVRGRFDDGRRTAPYACPCRPGWSAADSMTVAERPLMPALAGQVGPRPTRRPPLAQVESSQDQARPAERRTRRPPLAQVESSQDQARPAERRTRRPPLAQVERRSLVSRLIRLGWMFR